MRVLIDTDVLLDVALGREPWDEASGAFLDLCQQGGCTAFVAWHSISNLYYYLAGKRKQDARAFIADLLAFVEVAPVAQQDMRFALEQDLPDFEDAMQVAAAVACRATRIVTRNLRHYKRAIVPAVAPGELLEELRG